jgi:hypothetical protein
MNVIYHLTSFSNDAMKISFIVFSLKVYDCFIIGAYCLYRIELRAKTIKFGSSITTERRTDEDGNNWTF